MPKQSVTHFSLFLFSDSTGGCPLSPSHYSSSCTTSVAGSCCAGTLVAGWRWRPIIKVCSEHKFTRAQERGHHQQPPPSQPALASLSLLCDVWGLELLYYNLQKKCYSLIRIQRIYNNQVLVAQ